MINRRTETRKKVRNICRHYLTSLTLNVSVESRLHAPTLAPNLTKENTYVSQVVKSWIKGKCINDEQWHYFQEKFSQISFETKLNIRGELCCVMTCFCIGKYQVIKSAQNVNYSERWYYGNLHRHLVKHFNNYLQSKSVSDEAVANIKSQPQVLPAIVSLENDCTKYKGAIKKQQGIMKLFTVSSRPSSSTQSNPGLHCSARDSVGNINRNDTQAQPTTQSKCEFTDETIVQDEAGPPKMNILSNQVVVQAMVHSSADNKVSLEIVSNNEDSTLNIDQQIPKDLICNEKRKWTSQTFQRNKRARRKGEDEVTNQPVITSSFTLFSTVERGVESIMENVIHGEQTESVGTRLNATIEALPQFKREPSANHRSHFLKMLINISIKKLNSSSSRYHY